MAERSTNILYNAPALNALKRHQLQSLTKRYGLKSNGKNSEMVQRLQDLTMSPTQALLSPPPSSTPGPNDFVSDDIEMSESGAENTPSHTRPGPNIIQQIQSHDQNQRGRGKTSTGSEAWEMLSDSGASLISPTKEVSKGMENSDSMRSWKSARNGQKLDEFGGSTTDLPASGSMSSIKSLASSIKRSASQHLLSRSRRNSFNMLAPVDPPLEVQEPEQEHERMEEMVDSLPPSPASTVGVPRRYSGLSLLERPSTIRLVASPPPPPEPDSEDEADDLPFVGTASNLKLLKERRSMAPLRSLDGSASGIGLSRKSMPAISANHTSASASFSTIYPPLPPMPTEFQGQNLESRVPSQPSMPGALPLSPVRHLQLQPEPFVFGSPQNAVSNREFSDAGKAILAQMNAKMPEGFGFNEEYLKGKQAGMNRLVKTTSTLGEGGWGLSGLGQVKPDRYAEAHQREFSKMRSISKQNLRSLSASTSTSVGAKPKSSTVTLNAGSTPAKRKRSSVHLPSAPNGAALPAESMEKVQDRDEAPEPKKKRMSYLGSLADAGRSLLSLGEAEKGPGQMSEKKMKPKRRSSLLPGGFKSKFGWLSRKKKSIGPVAKTAPFIPAPIMPRKTSVYAPRNPPAPRPVFDLNTSLSKSTTISTRAPTSYTSPTIVQKQKQRQASSSAQKMLSVSTTASRSRSRIPDFGPATGNNAAAASSVNTLGLPKPSSSSASAASSMRKQSQAEILKKVRPAPAPPASSASTADSVPPVPSRPKATSTITSSRLYAPTASSMARMQATVKPSGARPMPSSASASALGAAAPKTAQVSGMTTSQPFGSAASRDNIVFQSKFNVSKPTAPPTHTHSQGQGGGGLRKGKSTSTTQLKSPLKSAASSRVRGQASGISAVKSRPDMKKEREVQARKAEIRAKQDRMGEERELRRMLWEDEGGGGAM